jgi:antitoxin ParD1/3/4
MFGIFPEKHLPKNPFISLNNHFESFVEEAITTGRYSTTSEVVRAGLRPRF